MTKEKTLSEIRFTSFSSFISEIEHENYTFICDKNLVLNYPILSNLKPIYIIDSKEENKTLEQLTSIFNFLYKNNVDKSYTLCIIGGGLTCDIGSLAASLWYRGIPHILIPTSLLAMTDAAIGGKTAVNFNQNKNLIGSFYTPEKILIDLNFLKTLSTEEYRQGLAEIFKHGIGLNEHLLQMLEKSEGIITREILEESIKTKIQIIEQDFHEKGIRKLLNFGHTIGHAIEINHNIKHGDAVAIGMLLETKISNLNGYTPDQEMNKVNSILTKYFPDKTSELNKEKIINSILYDKKKENKYLHIPMIEKIGKSSIIKIEISEYVKLLNNIL